MIKCLTITKAKKAFTLISTNPFSVGVLSRSRFGTAFLFLMFYAKEISDKDILLSLMFPFIGRLELNVDLAAGALGIEAPAVGMLFLG